MYEAFYGLEEKPFSLTPDPAYLYLSRKHLLALSLLQYGLSVQAGFTVVTGEVGSGKTTLIRRLLQEISHDISVGLITNTHSAFGDILEWVLLAFDLNYREKSKVERYDSFVSFLVEQYAKGRRTVLIIDEAQNMDIATLEELRLLSNINADKDQVLEIILVGQPELLEKLQRQELRQFVQRITVDYHLTSLERLETQEYIEHRIKVAGGKHEIFEESVYDLIHQFTDGVPRLINNLCDMALVYGFAEEKQTIDAETIRSVVADRRLGGLKTLSDDKGKPSLRREISQEAQQPSEATSSRPNQEPVLNPSSSVVIDLEDHTIVESPVRKRSGRHQLEKQADPTLDDGTDKPASPKRKRNAELSTEPAKRRRKASGNLKTQIASALKEPVAAENEPRRRDSLKLSQRENHLVSNIHLVKPASSAVKPTEKPVTSTDRTRAPERKQTDTPSQGRASEPTQTTSGQSTVLATSEGPVSEPNQTAGARNSGSDKSRAEDLPITEPQDEKRNHLYIVLPILLFIVVGLVLLFVPKPLKIGLPSEISSDLNQPTQKPEPLREQELKTQSFSTVPGEREKLGDGFGLVEEPDDRDSLDQIFPSQEGTRKFQDRPLEIPGQFFGRPDQIALPANPKLTADKTEAIRQRESAEDKLDFGPVIEDLSESAVTARNPAENQTAEPLQQEIAEVLTTGELSQFDRPKFKERDAPPSDTDSLVPVDPKLKIEQLSDLDTSELVSNTPAQNSPEDSEFDGVSSDRTQKLSAEEKINPNESSLIKQDPKYIDPHSEQQRTPKIGELRLLEGVKPETTEDLEQDPNIATTTSPMTPSTQQTGNLRTSEGEEVSGETETSTSQLPSADREVIIVTPDQPYISEQLRSGDQARFLASLMIGEKQNFPLAEDDRTESAPTVESVAKENDDANLVGEPIASRGNASNQSLVLALQTPVDESITASTAQQDAWQSGLEFLIWDRLKKLGLVPPNQTRVPSEIGFSSAVRRFQTQYNLEVDGQPSQQLLNNLDQQLIAMKRKSGAQTAIGDTPGQGSDAMIPSMTPIPSERGQGAQPSSGSAVKIEDLASLVTEIQALLRLTGFDPGSIDGIPGQKTRSAIRDYQDSVAMAADGRPSYELLSRLQEQLGISGQ